MLQLIRRFIVSLTKGNKPKEKQGNKAIRQLREFRRVEHERMLKLSNMRRTGQA